MLNRKILIFLLVVAIAATASSRKTHKKKHERKHFLKEATTESEKDTLDFLIDDEADEEKKKKHKESTPLENDLDSDVLNNEKGGYPEVKDPCADHKCGPGKVCELDEDGKPKCACIKVCPVEEDERRKVCSNHNETWASDCELYHMRCVCTEGLEGCKLHKYKHVHVDYYGPCKDIGECTESEMEDFPRRMRDWLFNIMQDLARREELHGATLKLEQEAETSNDRKWVNAVIWKFCDLDVHPQDRKVSRHELFPIRAPLMAMEHCIAPFLDSCDSDDDHVVTLNEWGKCLGLKEDEIQDKCATMHKNRKG